MRRSRRAPNSALARLFSDQGRAGETIAFCLPGGAPLFLAGETADQLFWLRTGRLGVFQPESGRGARMFGVVGPGEPVGEMSLIAAAPHSANVVALRDCELIALPRARLFEAVESDPRLMAELARLIVMRSRGGADISASNDPSVFGFIAVSAGVDAQAFAATVGEAVRALGYKTVSAGEDALGRPIDWFSDLERDNDFVIYAADTHDAWTHFVVRQSDHLFLIADGRTKPPAGRSAETAASENRTAELILLQAPDAKVPVGGAAWCAAMDVAGLFHVRRDHSADIARIARVVSGSAVGLVLSGGAARAFAHVGAIRVLRNRGVPIDFIAGSSMGAIIGAGVALEWPQDELERRLRSAFVDSSPVADIAIPLVSLSRGGIMRRRLQEHFGDCDIRDLWRPFLCVSSNLTTGSYRTHRQGLLREALAATAALPGVLPPVVQGEDILVDGAIVNNFPADILHTISDGPIVGVDVTLGRSVDAHDVAPVSLWRWLTSGDWRKGPPIVSLLMRAATMSSARELSSSRAMADVLIQPPVDHIEIRDWKAFDAAVAAGEQTTNEVLDALATPLLEMHRRPPKSPAGAIIDAGDGTADRAASIDRPGDA